MTMLASHRPRAAFGTALAAALLLPAVAAPPQAAARPQEPVNVGQPEDPPEQEAGQEQDLEPTPGRVEGRGQVQVQVRVQAQDAGPPAVIVEAQEGVAAEVNVVEAPAAAIPQDSVPAEVPQDPAAMLQQQIAAQAAQYERLISRVLVQNLALARTLCGELPAESRGRIRVAGEEAVKKAAREIAAGLFQQQQQVVVVPEARPENVVEAVGHAVVRLFGLEPARPAAPPPPPPPPPMADPEAIVAEAVALALEAEAGADAARAFRDEAAARLTRQRRLAVGRIMRVLDGELHFSGRQREAIRGALEANWSDDLRMLEDMGSWTINGRHVYPGLDRAIVMPHLTDIQRRRLGEVDESQRESVRFNVDQWRRQAAVNRLMRHSHEPVERDAWWGE